MRNKAFTKRMLAVALSIIMVLGLMPLTAFAANDYPGYGGFSHIPLSACGTYPIQSDAWNEYGEEYVLTFATTGAGSIEKTGEAADGSWQTYEAGAYTGWEFSRWVVFYDGVFASGSDPTFDGKYYFSNVGSSSTALNVNNPTLQINKDPAARYNYYVYAVFYPVVSFEIDHGMGELTVKDTKGSIDIVNEGTSGKHAVRYGKNMIYIFANFEYPFVKFEKKIYVNGVDKTGEFINQGLNLFYDFFFEDITAPTSVRITTVVPTTKVSFDANGGSGSMTSLTFEYGKEQALTANNFARIGYTFRCWNTKANGTGFSYTDKQSVVFTPENNGDSLTLYAQWIECKNHTWTDGECTDCGIACSHSGGTATCIAQAACSECGMKYGDLKDHSYTYSASGTVITETCTNGCDHSESATVNAPAGAPVYDGTEKKATVSYSDGWQGGELTITYVPGNINAADVTAKITIGGVTALVNYTIDKMEPAYTVPTGLTATYGDTLTDVILPEGWSWKDRTASVGDAVTNTFKVIFTPANTDNYKTVEADVSVKVEPKEIGISWGTTEFTYCEGKVQAPTATATGIITGDQIALIISGEKVDAGSYTATVTGITGDKAANYKLPRNVTTAFTIGNAFQTVPVVTGINETVSAKADGKITGVDSTMEYRKDGESTYTAIGGTELTDLEAGKYYVRYAAKANYNASADTEVTIASGRKLTVTVPQNQNGYTLTVDQTEFEYRGGFYITFHIAEGYSKTEDFAIKLNGKDMQWGDFNEMGVQSCTTDIEISVEGVALKTYTVTYTDENGTVKIVTVEHGKKPEIPETPVKEGYMVTWEEVPDAVTGDLTIKAICTPIPVKDSPQTGEITNLWLWVAAMFIGGGLLFGTFMRKRRSEKTKS